MITQIQPLGFEQSLQNVRNFNSQLLVDWDLKQIENLASGSYEQIYFNDIPDKTAIPKCFQNSDMSLVNVCLGEDANEGVDLYLRKDFLSENLGPDRIPDGEIQRPSAAMAPKKKRKKSRDGKHHHKSKDKKSK